MSKEEYKARTTTPSQTDAHYYSNENIYHACGCGMYHNGKYAGNCTAYAWGRLWEITGTRYMQLTGNAEDMYESAIKCGLKPQSYPTLGSLIVWASGKTHDSSDGCGHIAVVERVNHDGSIVVSESGWDAYLWKLETIKPPYKRSNYTLLGFINCGVDWDMSNEDTGYYYQGADYSLVFDSKYYAEKYQDLMKAFGYNRQMLFDHFVKNGMIEKRQATMGFNVLAYKYRYPDLQKAFGDDIPSYYRHYCTNGYKENRIAL